MFRILKQTKGYVRVFSIELRKKIKIYLIKTIKTNIIYINNFLCRSEREMEMWRAIIGIRL